MSKILWESNSMGEVQMILRYYTTERAASTAAGYLSTQRNFRSPRHSGEALSGQYKTHRLLVEHDQMGLRNISLESGIWFYDHK